VEREREIGGFKAESSFKVVALFEAKDKFGNTVTLSGTHKNKPNQSAASEFVNKLYWCWLYSECMVR